MRSRGRYIRAAARIAIVIGGKSVNQVSGRGDAPTARPPRRSTKTASVRTRASATGAKTHQLIADRVGVSVAPRA